VGQLGVGEPRPRAGRADAGACRRAVSPRATTACLFGGVMFGVVALRSSEPPRDDLHVMEAYAASPSSPASERPSAEAIMTSNGTTRSAGIA
jgi:hypothetical protein